jgi:hypothetical protein
MLFALDLGQVGQFRIAKFGLPIATNRHTVATSEKVEAGRPWQAGIS